MKSKMLETALVGSMTTKTDERINFFGVADELSTFIMELRHHLKSEEMKMELIDIVNKLYLMMGVVAGGENKFGENELNSLLRLNKKYEVFTGKLTEFVLPGLDYVSAKIHIVRTITRRTELAYAKVYDKYGGNDYIFEYLNKLSTLFYNLALLFEHNIQAIGA